MPNASLDIVRDVSDYKGTQVMKRQNVIGAGLLIIASAIVVTAGYAKGWGPLGLFNASVTRAFGGNTQVVATNTLVSESAPEFAPGTWINSEPLTLKSLKGRVVLVDFWTFGCYNCRNTLPYLKSWHERYADKGLAIVGVHSPEFDAEKKIENVRREIASLGIRYPVVTDND